MNSPAQGPQRRLSPPLIGRIVLARFLETPPARLRQLVERIEAHSLFRASVAGGERRLFKSTTLAGVRTLASVQEKSAGAVAALRIEGSTVRVHYTAQAFVRQYDIDGGQLGVLLADGHYGQQIRAELIRLVRSMRLVNTRNRLTHAVILALAQEQIRYLSSLDPLDLKPLRQLQLLPGIKSLVKGVDASRLSRIFKQLALILPDGQKVRGVELLRAPHQVCKLSVREALREESEAMARGVLRYPLTDQALANCVSRKTGMTCSRRTIASYRHALGIPSWNHRARARCYLTATEAFSPVYPLAPETVRDVMPQRSGVYELRLMTRVIDYAQGGSPVFYVGSSQNLRKRVLEHLRPGTRNQAIRKFLDSGAVGFRFCCLPHGKAEERRVYRQFVGTFGTPPVCNRSHP